MGQATNTTQTSYTEDEVAILVGTTVGKRLGRSWAAFLKLV